jgi:hypothetical protein
MVRLSYLASAGFPLGDGGLFYVMVQDLQQAGYRLPVETSYNGAAIPYAYPPLGLYLAGLGQQMGPWSLLDVFRWLPFALSLLTIAAFAHLAGKLLGTTSAAGVATGAFALLPMGFQWLLMGGGVTRALGLLFAILALAQLSEVYRGASRRAVALATIFAAGTALSHPAMAWFLAYSAGLFFLAFGRSRVAIGRMLSVGVGTVLLTAPWWGAVLARHGAGPLFASGGSTLSAFGPLRLLTLTITNEPFFPVLGALALVGALWCMRPGWWWLPTWVVAMAGLDSRSPLASASVPLALLAGIGAAKVVLPWLDGSAAPRGAAARADEQRPRQPALGFPPRRLTALVVALALLLALLNATVDQEGVLASITADQQTAMRWVAEQTPTGASFLVITASLFPTRDRVAEWFPAIARRPSATTVQGYEWVSRAFAQRLAAYSVVQPCAYRDAACVEAWLESSGAPVTHVFVPKGATGATMVAPLVEDCCWSLRASLRTDGGHRLVYDGPGASVYERMAPPTGMP